MNKDELLSFIDTQIERCEERLNEEVAGSPSYNRLAGEKQAYRRVKQQLTEE